MSRSCKSAAFETDTPGEFHIAGIVVYTQPALRDSVMQNIGMLPGAEVHAVTPDAKLVVTLEGALSSHVAEQMSAIQALPGVCAAALIYQHHEDIDSLNEEIVDEADPSRVH